MRAEADSPEPTGQRVYTTAGTPLQAAPSNRVGPQPIDPVLASSQSAANGTSGARSLPARVIPVPAGLDDVGADLVAGPYSPSWNLAPDDAAAWRDVQSRRSDIFAPLIEPLRTRLRVSSEQVVVGGVDCYLLRPRTGRSGQAGLIFYLHGGGYVLGGGEAGTFEAVLMAAYSGHCVLSVDYRLAPDAPFPAALEDALETWRAVAARGDTREMAIAGISAGGGLALSLLLRVKADRLPLPGALVLGSPYADMTKTGDSYATNEWLDNVLVSYDGYLARAGRLYAGDRDLRDPALSPIYGDLSGLPPTILFTGTRDLFLSNTVRTHRALRAAGVEADLHVFEGLAHAQYALHERAPATKQTYGEVASFLARHLRLP